MGAPSLDWQAAYARLQAADARTSVPTLLLETQAGSACPSPTNATVVTIQGAGAVLELEDDAHRAPWLAAITAFLAERAPKSVQPAPPHGP